MNIPLHSHSGIPGVINFNQQGINLTDYLLLQEFHILNFCNKSHVTKPLYLIVIIFGII